MTNTKSFERMLNKEHRPSKELILETIGETAPYWLDLNRYIKASYDFEPELVFYGKKYGWTLRYRKSGRTLCSLFPETEAFSTLIVLGKKEAEKALAVLDGFNAKIRAVLQNTDQLHDGRWLWIRVLDPDDVEDLKKLLRIKKRPKFNR